MISKCTSLPAVTCSVSALLEVHKNHWIAVGEDFSFAYSALLASGYTLMRQSTELAEFHALLLVASSITVVVSAVTSQGHRGSCWMFSATQALVSRQVLISGGYRVELSRVARRPLARMFFMVGDGGWTEGVFVFLSTIADLAFSFYTPFECLTEGTAAMACPTERVANINGEFDWQVTRVGVRLRLCGRRLRSRSPWSGAEVDGVDFLVPALRCRAGGAMSTGTWPQGALVGMDGQTPC